MALTGAALADRLNPAVTPGVLQLAADARAPQLEEVRREAGLGPEILDAEVARAASELLIAFTAARLEQAGKASEAMRDAPAQAALGFGARLGGAMGLRLNSRRNPGEGPDPVLRGPRKKDLARAMTRLRVLGAQRKLSSEDTGVLLEQAAWATRQGLAGTRWVSNVGDKAFTPKNIQGACGFGQACTAFYLAELGIPEADIHLHQAADAFPGNTFRHAFVVAKMPDGKPYLIDCTFRQFFRPDAERPNQVGEPGRLMRATRRGREVADELLSKGFVELTDEVAKLYGGALSTQPGIDVSAEALLRSTMEIDYDRAEIVTLPAVPDLPDAPSPRTGEAPPSIRGPP